MPKYHVMFARFPYHNQESPSSADWLFKTIMACKDNPLIGPISLAKWDDTPITMNRNRSIKQALREKADILVMLDNDMYPDLYLPTDPEAKPFFDTALQHLVEHPGPCAIGAPYCGPPPHENVYVFQWADHQSDHPNKDMGLKQFTREEASKLKGIVKVAALPTGLFMLDMRAIRALQDDLAYFDYEWTDESQTEKASTEDVVFTRNLSLCGVPQYCAFDCWAGHWKLKCVGRPDPLTDDAVADMLRESLMRAKNEPGDKRTLAEVKTPSNQEILAQLERRKRDNAATETATTAARDQDDPVDAIHPAFLKPYLVDRAPIKQGNE